MNRKEFAQSLEAEQSSQEQIDVIEHIKSIVSKCIEDPSYRNSSDFNDEYNLLIEQCCIQGSTVIDAVKYELSIHKDVLKIGLSTFNRDIKGLKEKRDKEQRFNVIENYAIDADKSNTVILTDDQGYDRPIQESAKEGFEILVKQNLDMDLGLFHYVGAIVKIYRNEHGFREIQPFDATRIRSALSVAVNWKEYLFTKEGIILKPVKTPEDIAKAVVAWEPYNKLPGLKGFSNHPILLEDYTFSYTKGYDPKSKWLFPEHTYCDLSKEKDMSVKEAKDFLIDMFDDFPFETESGLAHLLSIPLTFICKNMIEGPVPAFGLTGTSGSGKTLLIQAMHLAITGEDIKERQVPDNSEEWRKTLMAALLTGDEMLFFDNVPIETNRDGFRKPLDANALASLITSRFFTDRLLGTSQNKNIENNNIFILSGEQLLLSSELSKRILPISLLPRTKEKEEYKHRPLSRYCKNNRGKFLKATTVLIEDWIKNDKPLSKEYIDRFEDWSEIIGGILENAGITGFLTEDELPKPTKKPLSVVEKNDVDNKKVFSAFIDKYLEYEHGSFTTGKKIRDLWEKYPDKKSTLLDRKGIRLFNKIMYNKFDLVSIGPGYDKKTKTQQYGYTNIKIK